jgi:uncharacterized NAD(P)/FAD-binding protein YdhS
MPGLDAPESRGPVVAIIGGGASGVLAAVHLLRSAVARQSPLRITLIDRYGRHGLGHAYATTHPDHLLNAPASQMSALAGDPDHLIRWAGPEVTDPAGTAAWPSPGDCARSAGTARNFPRSDPIGPRA